MEYQETGRLGRITKNLRKLGFQKEMETILFDSKQFINLKKKQQTEYIETIMERMVKSLDQQTTDKVLFECGDQCCGKSWRNFARGIWEKSKGTIENFIVNLNIEEEKYNTHIFYDLDTHLITVIRKKCICGLINKGDPFKKNKSFCNCSIGHMDAFFRSVLPVDQIQFKKSIMNGDSICEWEIKLNNNS